METSFSHCGEACNLRQLTFFLEKKIQNFQNQNFGELNDSHTSHVSGLNTWSSLFFEVVQFEIDMEPQFSRFHDIIRAKICTLLFCHEEHFYEVFFPNP